MTISRRFQAIFSVEGDKSVLSALSRIEQGMKRTGNAQRRAAKGGTELGRSFRNILLRSIAIIGVLRTFDLVTDAISRAVKMGLEFNETIETAELSIASLITATADLVDINGNVLEGVEALDAAYGLAEDQVQKLRIAGIQTAATTQDLVNAFQQAVGAGVQTGLTLDEIRKITIRLTQAAGALGVPYRQLNEEIRSLFQGAITPQNTRIATALGITNADIVRAKELGTLAEFLLDSFNAFDVAGDRIVNTFAALKSNIQETIEILLGDITSPLFKALRTRGATQLGRVFDFDTGEIAEEFEGLIDGMQDVFFFLGDTVGDLIEGIVNQLQRISEQFAENRDSIAEMGQDLSSILQSVGSITVDFVTLLTTSGLIADTVELIADVLRFIVDNPMTSWVLLIGTVLGGLGLIAAVFNPMVAGITAAVILLGTIAQSYDNFNTSTAEATREQTRRIIALEDERAELGQVTRANSRLLQQYEFLIEKLKTLESGTAEHTTALGRLLAVERDLENGGFNQLLKDANGDRELAARLIREQLEAELALLRVQLLQIAADKRRVSNEASATRDTGDQRDLLDRLAALDITQAGTLADFIEINRLLTEGFAELISNSDEAADVLDALRARIKVTMAQIAADLELVEAKLEDQLDRNQIGITDFFDRIIAAREQAFQRRVAAQRELLQAERDAGNLERAATVEAKLLDIQTDRRVQRIKEQNELLEAQQKLSDDLLNVNIQLLEATGQGFEALAARLNLQFRDLFLRLKAEGDEAGIALINSLINVQLAKERFSQIEDIIEETRARFRAQQALIQLQDQSGILSDEQSRRAQAANLQDLRDAIGENIVELEKFAAVSKDPATLRAAEALRAEYAQLGLEIRILTDDWLRFKAEFRSIVEDSLANFLSEAVLEAENLGQAFANLANVRSLFASIAAAVVDLTAKLIALKIVQAATGLPGLSSGGSVSSLLLASGGQVRGPGGPRQDKVLARLSAGEYVVQARSVKKFGTDFFDRVNAGVVPRELKGFAAGGLVGAVSRDSLTAPAGDMSGQLGIGLSEGLVVKSMDTPAGSRLIMKVISKNRRALGRSLGN